MQYVKVVPNTTTNLQTQSFSYAIPSELLPMIKVGILVKVPFGKRKIEGIITEITRKKGETTKEKIKPILSIINPNPLIDEIHLKLARWMAEYYFAPLSKCLFEMLPSLPKRKKTILPSSKINNHLPNSIPTPSILKLCQQAISKNKQVIILFPEVKLAKIFYFHLQKKFKKTMLYHSELSKTERYYAWEKIKQGKIDIVCGSRLALFAPLNRLGLIIIAEEDAEGYKNERTPRYNVKTVAQKLCQLTGSKLILMSQTPSIESYYHFGLKKQSKMVYLARYPKSPPLHQTTAIIDMKNEIKKGNKSSLSEALQAQLKRIYQQGKTAVLFTSRRGAASYIFCRQCGYILKCPHCDLPLVYHLQSPYSNQLICHHCTFKTKLISICPNCQGINFKFLGFGTQRIESELKKLFLKPNILRIDKDLPFSLSNNIKNESLPLFVIGTQKLIPNWVLPADLVAVVSIDNLLNLPDLNSAHKVFSIITKLRMLNPSVFYLQTYHPENFIFSASLNQKGWHEFIQKELENRRKLALPPFTKLIRIICQHKKEEKCKKDTQIIADKINSLLPSSATIFGPSPCFYSKIREKYRWHIVLNLKNKNLNQYRRIFNLLKKLPQDWIIDIDPITLL